MQIWKSSKSNSTTPSKSTASNSAQNEAVSILAEEIETNIQPQLLYKTIYDDPAYAVSEFNQELRPIRQILKDYKSNKKGFKFNSKSYSNHSWLEYSKSKNAAFCFVCRYFCENNSKIEPIYTKDGFTNFKKACEKLKNHESSNVISLLIRSFSKKKF